MIMSGPGGLVLSTGWAACRTADDDRVLRMARGMRLSDGPSYWTARGLDSGEIAGLGGARPDLEPQLPDRHQQRRRGLGATQLIIAADHAAAIVDPSVAFYLLGRRAHPGVTPSAERIGLTNQGPVRLLAIAGSGSLTATDGSIDRPPNAPLQDSGERLVASISACERTNATTAAWTIDPTSLCQAWR